MRQNTKPMSRKQPQAKPKPVTNRGERINRYLATCGLCSRREADRWILAGRVKVNGSIVDAPGISIKAGDKVEVDGKEVEPLTKLTYIAYNKPRGLLCSRKDAKSRSLIYEHLDVAPNVQSIGRLDMDSEGLLLLTNDGKLARALTRPGSLLPRTYRVRLTGKVSLEALGTLREGGVDIGKGERSEPWDVIVDSETSGHTWLTISLRRGRWREVRRTLDAHGHQVRRLIRVRFGSVKLGDLASGKTRKLRETELIKLKLYLK